MLRCFETEHLDFKKNKCTYWKGLDLALPSQVMALFVLNPTRNQTEGGKIPQKTPQTQPWRSHQEFRARAAPHQKSGAWISFAKYSRAWRAREKGAWEKISSSRMWEVESSGQLDRNAWKRLGAGSSHSSSAWSTNQFQPPLDLVKVRCNKNKLLPACPELLK